MYDDFWRRSLDKAAKKGNFSAFDPVTRRCGCRHKGMMEEECFVTDEMYKIAILYQVQLPPAKDGVQKPMQPRGHSDSGADIAFELLQNNLDVVNPVENPNQNNDKDWVFPDTIRGIELTLRKGAKIFDIIST